MKKTLYILSLLLGIVIIGSSCKKILDKSPQDQISDPQFWKTPADLQLYVNNLYSVLPGWNLSGAGGNPLLDASTDVAISVGLFATNKNALDGVVNIPASGGGWTWTNIRSVNYFLDNASRVPDGGLKNQYIGEAYFFRAWNYFEMLKKFGDLPIITKTLDPGIDADMKILFGARSSRTDVVNFIIKDLDLAISLMDVKANLAASRVNKDIAALFESRVCLYEGTWEKYHANDAFKGTTDGTAFLTKAASAAKSVIDGARYSLITGDPNQVYYNLFNQIDYSKNNEVMFYRGYNGAAYGGNFSNQVWNWPNGSGITKYMMEMYLCTDGKPSSVSPLYKGDKDIRQVILNRDPRCVQTVMNPGDAVTVGLKNDTTFYTTPGLSSTYNSATGYESQKFRRPQIDPATGGYSGDQAYIIFRYAEALINYAEAKGELAQLTQADLDISVNKLRDRVAMPRMTLGLITPDPAWPVYGYYTLPDYLHEIRREREVELFSEGFRFNDLMRWRADKIIVGQRPKGAFYSAELKATNASLVADANGYLDPYLTQLKGPGTWGFDPSKNYLQPLPTNELTLSTALKQNPGW
ncbi:MAG: RagB/SusD family nutrient uptake outer membrane protein [Bacteroidetes bacterium]|nr:RagB/SusD family nutrient uptake outer membrane protein [Bacteroidota bacterium]